MNEMVRPTSNRVFQAIGLGIMGLFVLLACWRVTHYIGIQNRSVANAIQTSREQIAQGRPISENYEKFLAALVEYLKITRDQNIVVLMQQSGVPVRVQDSPAAPQAGPGQPAGAAPEPAKR